MDKTGVNNLDMQKVYEEQFKDYYNFQFSFTSFT